LVELLHRLAADARIVIAARERRNDLAAVFVEIAHRGGAHQRVAVAPSRKESIENRHGCVRLRSLLAPWTRGKPATASDVMLRENSAARRRMVWPMQRCGQRRPGAS